MDDLFANIGEDAPVSKKKKKASTPAAASTMHESASVDMKFIGIKVPQQTKIEFQTVLAQNNVKLAHFFRHFIDEAIAGNIDLDSEDFAKYRAR